MSSVEALQKIISEDLSKACTTIFNMFKDKVEPLKQTIQRLAQLISDDKNDKQPRYLTVLVDLLEKSINKIPSGELIDLFQNALPEEGHRVVKRARRMAFVLCLFAIVKSGFAHKNENLLNQIVTEIFRITEENIWMQAACYKILIEIIIQEINKEDLFLDNYISIFAPIREPIPSTVDKFYFWLKLQTLFPKIELPEFYHDPLTTDSFVRFTSLLKTTTVSLPFIHPIWTLFAEIDAKQLLQIINEIWVEKNQNRTLISIACGAAVPYLAPPELIEFIQNAKLFEYALSTKANSHLMETLNRQIIPIIEQGDESSFELLRALLLIPNEHSYVNEAINKCCTLLDDAQTRKLLDHLHDLPFKGFSLLLWAQRHRTVIADDSILTDLFALASKAAANFSEKVELSNFLAKSINRTTSSGKTWFKLISGHEIPSTGTVNSIENLIAVTNKTIKGLNEISQMLNITPIFDPCDVTKESFLSLISQLNKSKFKHWHQVARILLQKAIPLLTAEDVPLLQSSSILLDLAARDPRLCEAALPLYVEKATNFHEYAEKPISFPISPERIEVILPKILTTCKGTSKNNIQEEIALHLISQISDEAASQIIKNHIDAILGDETNEVGGDLVVTKLIESSATMAFDILTHIEVVGTQYDKQSAIKRMETWVDACCRSNEIPVDDIAKAICAVLDHPYQATSSGKKKAEAVLVWAEKLIKKLPRPIPRDVFVPLIDKFSNIGSRNAATIIKQLSQE